MPAARALLPDADVGLVGVEAEAGQGRRRRRCLAALAQLRAEDLGQVVVVGGGGAGAGDDAGGGVPSRSWGRTGKAVAAAPLDQEVGLHVAAAREHGRLVVRSSPPPRTSRRCPVFFLTNRFCKRLSFNTREDE